MKRSITISALLIFTFGSLSIRSQSYIPFPDTTINWSIHGQTSSFYSYGNPGTQTVLTLGDSIYNAATYTKIFRGNQNFPVGMYRQDITAKKVYWVEAGTNTEKILYDFSLSVGDTAKVNGYRIKVAARDSVLVNGSYRKRMKIASNSLSYYTGPEYWIEGIGSSYGFLNSGMVDKYMMDVGPPWLVCMSVAGSLVYPSSSFTACHIASTIGVAENAANGGFAVYPNPSSGTVNYYTLPGMSIEVFDILGRRLQDFKATSPSGEIILPTKGLYFIHAGDDKRAVTVRVVVTE
jgi:hypothetical protein